MTGEVKAVEVVKVNAETAKELGAYHELVDSDDLVPMEEWNGECWKTMFDTLAEMVPEHDPWDVFAAFMRNVLKDEDKE